MNERERELTRRWIEAWERAGPALERVEAEELAHYDYEKNRHLIDALCEIGARFARPRTTSGLVEQQRLFMKARREAEDQHD